MKVRSYIESRSTNTQNLVQHAPVIGPAAQPSKQTDSYGVGAPAPLGNQNNHRQQYTNAVDQLYKHFNEIDDAGETWLKGRKDKKIGLADLEAVVNDPKFAGDEYEELRTACQFLLNNDEAFAQLDGTLNGEHDGIIGEIDVIIAKQAQDKDLPAWARERIDAYVEDYLNAGGNREAEAQAKQNMDSIRRLAQGFERGEYNQDQVNAVLFAIDNAYATEYPDGSPTMDSVNLGGDCANFVSHALEEGGLRQNDDWNFNGVTDKAPLDPNRLRGRTKNVDGTESWLRANALRDYLINSGHEEVANIKNLDGVEEAVKNGQLVPGDVVIFAYANDDDKHAVIITDVDVETGKAYYSGHSSPRQNRDLTLAFTDGEDPVDHMHVIRPSNFKNETVYYMPYFNPNDSEGRTYSV
jgi:hypothetical protein